MKERKIIGVELSEEDYKNRAFIKVDFDTDELLPEKKYYDYLREFLLTEKNYNKVMESFNEYKKKSLPKDIKTKCKFCTGESQEENDKDCGRYYDQMSITFVMASYEFIDIVLRHKFIYNNKKQLFKLTINFFNCFSFIMNKGLMYFDLDKMIKFSLNAGFLSLSDMFSKSSALYSLTVINDTLDSIQDEEIENRLFEKEDHNYLDLQIEFFKNKKGIYETKVLIEKEEKTQKSSRVEEEKLFSVLEWATIFYYADESKLLLQKKYVKDRMKVFINTHDIITTFESFKNQYSIAKRRINKKNDYPIEKLELILPFLKEHYKQTVTKVENDIFILKEYVSDNQ